jgi:2-methylcitrate dehydratase PrpD
MSDSNTAIGLTRRLVDFYAGLEYESLPPDVIEWTKYFCLDYLGMALRGAIVPSSISISRTVERLSNGGKSLVMGTGLCVSPEYAAMANGTAAHSLELDDTSNEASLHPSVATFPAAFACGDMARVTGKDFISAMVCGYDLMVRLGYALDPRSHYARGFHPTGTCGAFAATLVASRLMGLDVQQTTSALGIAGGQASGSLEWLADGSWTKRLNPGWAAHSGIIAAALAQGGFTGPSTVLEGKNGFLHGYSGGSDPSRLTDRLGDLYYIAKVSIKPHACCRYNQGPIDCVLQIAAEIDLKPDQVKEITVGVLKAGYNTVAAPIEEKRAPKSVVDAQFSMPFAAAIAVLYGRASLNEYTDEVLAEPQMKDMMSKVICVEDDAIEADFPRKWPAWVEVVTTDGRRTRADVEYPKGDPVNPLSWEELEGKFRGLTEPVISSHRQDQIISAVKSLEKIDDVRELAWLTAT